MAGGGQRGDDGDITLVLLVGLFFLIGWFIWTSAKQPIVEGIRWAKIAETYVFQLVDPALARDRELLSLNNNQAAIKALNEQASKAKVELKEPDYISRQLLAPSVLWDASNHIGAVTRWPIAAFMFGWAIFYMFFTKKSKFRNKYGLEGLIKVQAQTWPVIAPIVNFNPTEDNSRKPGEAVPTSLPLFAEGLSPEEWVAMNRIPVVKGEGDKQFPDREATRRAFQQQLGPRWTGPGCLDDAQRCLYAAFALKGAQKRKESDALLGRIALCWTATGGFAPSAELMAEVNKHIKDENIGGVADKIAENFAFRTTALIGTLKWARDRGGVLAPATFIWLRGHDRALWYPLNNLGRRSYHMEAAGAMAHYMAERDARRALQVPRLETAIAALGVYWNKDKDPAGRPIFPTVPPLKEGKKA